jgi:hypothetical protein
MTLLAALPRNAINELWAEAWGHFADERSANGGDPLCTRIYKIVHFLIT